MVSSDSDRLRIARIAAVASLSVCLAAADSAQADDIFILKTGGQVRGQWLNKEESPRQQYRIRTAAGGEVTLAADQIEQFVLRSEEELLYEKIRPTHPDTVEGHLKMAQWCQDQKLTKERRWHLERIVELDPNHSDARAALGYLRSGGQWVTREEMMGARGMIVYKGRYRTRQEIEIWEEERKHELATREWATKIKRWRGWLEGEKSATARQSFKAIKDPYAIPALAAYLQQNERASIKILLIETLAQIPSPAALKVLVQCSLQDPDNEVRLTAQEYVVKSQAHDAVNMYIVALKSKDNNEVNRAARALGELDNPAAIEPLFDALVTEHKYKVVTGQAPGSMTTTFRPGGGGGGGLSFNGDGPKIIKNQQRNPEALNALLVLTGENYHYDVSGWKRWYANKQRSTTINARRD